jgi:hypothetical protein
VARHNTGEPEDIYAAAGLMISPQTQNVGSETFTTPRDILIEGLRIIPQQNATASEAPYGIEILGGQMIVIRDVTISGGASNEAVHVLSRNSGINEHLVFERVRVPDGARRNGMAFTNVRHLTLVDVSIASVSADSPADQFPPGMGIDFEPNNAADVFEHIRLSRVMVRQSAASGVGLNFTGWWSGMPASVKDVEIESCTIIDNGQASSLPGGGSHYGGVYFSGGTNAGAGASSIRLRGNYIRGNLRGDSLHGSTNLVLIVTANDLVPAPTRAAIGVSYDTSRSIVANNLLT